MQAALDRQLLDACRAGDVIAPLLKRGADPNARAPASEGSRTPLLVVCDSLLEPSAAGAAALLVSAGADVRAVDSEGQTALHFVAGTCTETAPSLIRLLAKVGGGPGWGQQMGDKIKAGPCMCTPTRSLATMAAQPPASLSLHHLLLPLSQYGAHANARDYKGTTPLMQAAAACSCDAVAALLSVGAGAHIADAQGRSALHYAAGAGADAAAAPAAAAIANAVRAAEGTELQCSAAAWSMPGQTPVKQGDGHMLAHGDCATQEDDGDGDGDASVLEDGDLLLPQMSECDQLISLLLAAGAEIGLPDATGWTPMQYAVAACNVPLVWALSWHGVRLPAHVPGALARALLSGLDAQRRSAQGRDQQLARLAEEVEELQGLRARGVLDGLWGRLERAWTEGTEGEEVSRRYRQMDSLPRGWTEEAEGEGAVVVAAVGRAAACGAGGAQSAAEEGRLGEADSVPLRKKQWGCGREGGGDKGLGGCGGICSSSVAVALPEGQQGQVWWQELERQREREKLLQQREEELRRLEEDMMRREGEMRRREIEVRQTEINISLTKARMSNLGGEVSHAGDSGDSPVLALQALKGEQEG